MGCYSGEFVSVEVIVRFHVTTDSTPRLRIGLEIVSCPILILSTHKGDCVMQNRRYLGSVTVDSQVVDGLSVDTFCRGIGPIERTIAVIRQDSDGWYRVDPLKGLSGCFRTYREAFMYVCSLYPR